MGKRTKEKERAKSKKRYRVKVGIPIDAKTWEYRKGQKVQRLSDRQRYRNSLEPNPDKAIINGRLRFKPEAIKAKRLNRSRQRWIKDRYKMFVLNSTKRGLAVEITEVELLELNKLPCSYCGGELPKYGCGLDRVNNDLGYLLDNVVPCCSLCNRTKSDKLSAEEMKLLIEFRKSK